MRRVLTFFFETTEVAAAGESERVPKQFVLSQNYPNPFNPTTILSFGLPVRSWVQVEIYNLIGQRVRNWPASLLDAGFHEQQWDGLNDAGLPVSSGEYFLRVSAESTGGEKLVRTVRMSLVR